jgi:subtilisin family serine protease
MARYGVVIAAALLVVAGGARAGPAGQPGRVLIGYRDGAAASALEQRLELTPVARISELRIDVVAVDRARAPVVLDALRLDREVRWAQLDRRVRALRVPNDPFWPSQWSPRLTHAPAAWERTVGDAQTVVGVVDTGLDATQPDLRGRVVPGFEFVQGDADPHDDNGHGTAVAGVIAAAGDNGVGVAGYCWRCRLMPLKVLGADGTGLSSDLARGIVWAADNGARVINASLEGPADDLAVAAATSYARARGALVVAAAGNDSSSTLGYPAALPGVVSVAASTPGDELYAFSNSGAALAAPGMNSTTSLGGGYERFLGTSSAAPVVSGIAGLLLGLVPSATLAQLTEVLERSAVPVTGVLYGRVDAQRALNALSPPPPSSSPHGRHPSRTTKRALRGRLAPHGRSLVIVTGPGLLRILFELRGKGSPRVGVVVRHGGRRVASRTGRRLVRLRLTVGKGRYRIILTGPAGRPFRLLLTYPRPL